MDGEADRARSAAAAFGREFGFAAEQVEEIEREPPVLGPAAFERDGRTLTAYRWLSGGRGGDFVQADVDAETGRIVVYGARGDSPFGPWDAVSPSSP